MDVNPPQLERAAAVRQLSCNTKEERRFRAPRRTPPRPQQEAELAEDEDTEKHQVDDVA